MTARPQESEEFWQELRQTLDRLKEDPKAWRRLMDELSIVESRYDPDPYYTPAEVEAILKEGRERWSGDEEPIYCLELSGISVKAERR